MNDNNKLYEMSEEEKDALVQKILLLCNLKFPDCKECPIPYDWKDKDHNCARCIPNYMFRSILSWSMPYSFELQRPEIDFEDTIDVHKYLWDLKISPPNLTVNFQTTPLTESDKKEK